MVSFGKGWLWSWCLCIACSVGIATKRTKSCTFVLWVSLSTLLNLLCMKVRSKLHSQDQIAAYRPAQNLCLLEQINMPAKFLDNNACHNLFSTCFLVLYTIPCPIYNTQLLCVIFYLDYKYFEEGAISLLCSGVVPSTEGLILNSKHTSKLNRTRAQRWALLSQPRTFAISE